MMMEKSETTTAEVVRRPTSSAPPAVASPCWQATIEMASPKATLLISPVETSQSETTRAVWLR